MFSSGFFIMIWTILRAYYSLKSLNTLAIALGWADRECFVAAIVVSLPGIEPLFKNSKWLGSSGGRGKSSGRPYYPGHHTYGSKSSKAYISSIVTGSGHHGGGNMGRHYELNDVSRNEDTGRWSTDSVHGILHDRGKEAGIGVLGMLYPRIFT